MRISDWSSDVCSSDLWSDPPRHDVDLSDRRRLRLALRDASAFAQRYCEVAVVETERAADRSKSARFQHNKTEARVVEHTDTHDRSLAVRRTDPADRKRKRLNSATNAPLVCRLLIEKK